MSQRRPVALHPAVGRGARARPPGDASGTGDRILLLETGHVGIEWARVAERLGLGFDRVAGGWRRGFDPTAMEERLGGEDAGSYKAALVPHNEPLTTVALAEREAPGSGETGATPF